MDAQEAIEVQAAGGPPSAVTELFLSGCMFDGGPLSLQLVPFVNLRSLNLNSCHLGSLENFPALPNLRLLELADNQLTGTLPVPLPHPPRTSPHLPAPSVHPPLTLTGDLEPLCAASLLALRELNLAGNLIEAQHSPPTTHDLPPTTHPSPIAHHPPPTTHCPPSPFQVIEVSVDGVLEHRCPLDSLSRLPNLRRLDLSRNLAASAPSYRESLMSGTW